MPSVNTLIVTPVNESTDYLVFIIKVSSTTDVLQREEEGDKDSMLMQLLTHPPLNAQDAAPPPAQQEHRQTGEDIVTSWPLILISSFK